MKIYKKMDDVWYLSNVSFLKELLDKIVWFGVWWQANWNGAIYTYIFKPWRDPLPITLFGKIDIFSFGINIKIKGGYFCFHWSYYDCNFYRFIKEIVSFNFYSYFSYNATPWGASKWFFGCPDKIKNNLLRPKGCGGKIPTQKDINKYE